MKTALDSQVPREVYHFLAALYLLALCAAFITTAAFGWQKALAAPQFAQAEDTFGYLQMAADIRNGGAPHGLPRFTFDSAHSRLLRHYFESQHLPVEDYASLLAPAAYHYQPASGLIANQYPPGVGLLLAMFPLAQSIHGASSLVAVFILLILCAGIAGLLRRGKSADLATCLAAAGFLCLAAMMAFLMFRLSVGYSIDLLALPLLLAFLAVHVAMSRDNFWGKFAAFAAGAFFGYAILCRLAAGLLIGGFLALLWLGRRAPQRAAKPLFFVLGVIIAGILPLMIHQRALTGSAFRSTYVGPDIAPPSLRAILPNALHYYAGAGNYAVAVTGLAVLAFCILLLGQRRKAARATGVARYGIALLLFWLLPTAFLMTHPVTTDYYQYPTILACVFTMAFAAYRVAATSTPDARIHPAFTVAAALLVGCCACGYASILPAVPSAESLRLPSLAVPAALRDPNAWIFAERFSGTLWHYDGIPAYDIVSAAPEARLEACRFIFDRHEPAYLIVDNPAIKPALQQLYDAGCQFEAAGTFADCDVLKILWPPKGPG